MYRVIAAIYTLLVVFGASCARAGVTCTLDHPDRDIKRLWPEATTYRVRELLPLRHGSKTMMATIEKELESPLDHEYETAETPYTFYAIYKGNEHVALLLGTNARAVDGPMQIFVLYDRKGNVRDVYVQKISSSDAMAFRSKFYRAQYQRFSINKLPEEADIKPPVRSPSNETINNHNLFLRGVKYNLLIVRHLYNNFSERAPTARSLIKE